MERDGHGLRVAEAMILLALARFLVANVRLARWSRALGQRRPGRVADADLGGHLDQVERAVRSAVMRAGQRLPGTSKCLPIAMATCWMLRRRNHGCAVVIGIAPHQSRGTLDDLHAWVLGRQAILGEMPGQYHPLAAFD